MEKLPSQWYGCAACGELRRFPFDEFEARPGCRCPPANGDPGPSTRKEEETHRHLLEEAHKATAHT